MTDRLARAIDDLRRKSVPDRRLGVFEVEAGDRVITGLTTSRDAMQALRALALEGGLKSDVRMLPDASVGTNAAAVVTSAVAPLFDQPKISLPRVTEGLHGEPLHILERRDPWLRVRTGDGYHAWIHDGYVSQGSMDWLDDWTGRAAGRTLGVELESEGARMRLPVGARLALHRDGRVEIADGRIARVVRGDVRPESELRAEARLVAAPEVGLRWFGGAPYSWGGRSDWGLDCSGFVQAVHGARGAALPRDSDQQFAIGREVPAAVNGAGYHSGDLLFFAEDGRVSHVAMWMGAGRIAHSTLARGGLVIEDLFADTPRMRRMRDHLVGVRRVS
ncbi:MAG TPA: C40 family peptidase [Gemmatimonadales bacterium]|nr:C40 family peptidase [Gemmatimonadales bacterium]